MTSLMMPLPTGFTMVPGGVFEASVLIGTPVEEFAMQDTPVTNGEWEETVTALDGDVFVLLDHDLETGETTIINQGKDIQAALNGPVTEKLDPCLNWVDFDLGQVSMTLGGKILLKMVDNPSTKYDGINGVIFSGDRQPVVGVSWFHAKAWCLLETIRKVDGWVRDLSNDLQFEYVATEKGTKKMGTSTGGLYGPNGEKLVHMDEFPNGTVAVDDPRYEPLKKRPFGIDTAGNVWRWTDFNAAGWKIKHTVKYVWEPYGMRGGGWGELAGYEYGHARRRNAGNPSEPHWDVGFQPVVKRQDLKSKP